MRIFCDTASLAEIEEWAAHPWVSGFTTNPTLLRTQHLGDAMEWARDAVRLADKKPISIDGPESVWDLGPNVWRKVCRPVIVPDPETTWKGPINYTAVCHPAQIVAAGWSFRYNPDDIISVFAGRIMDTGRDPQPVIDAAKQTHAAILWASVREPYNIVQAEAAGCDIVTVPPSILRKYLDWHGRPLEAVAEGTIAQFDRDRDGLW